MLWTHRLLLLFSDHVSWYQVLTVNHLLRKTGHFVGYATLSWFAFRGWTATLRWLRQRSLLRARRSEEEMEHDRSLYRWHLRAAILAIVFTSVVACLDEFHQSFLPGRTGVFHDVILDSLGGIFAQIVVLLYWNIRRTGPA